MACLRSEQKQIDNKVLKKKKPNLTLGQCMGSGAGTWSQNRTRNLFLANFTKKKTVW